MPRKLLPALLAMLLAAAPALAATEYFVAQKPTNKTCSVVRAKPDGKSAMMIGTSSYKTEAMAKAAMTKAPECQKK
ncbi:hypothetical protein SAZ10_27345 [Mesorhizobium sp. BAC0120]|uniref:hypothetical protein n=1 Tax=Mesorhizobium sp. BAC0120 TaxID=3090670 RepID=UPI00298C5DD3|nr:hypothetical protein [Mesorhizobium sp. BAC0120]MDW6025484.1 hypothetical protein [Mesorhizobium sp. BAC0120]